MPVAIRTATYARSLFRRNTHLVTRLCVYTAEGPPSRRSCHQRAQDIDDNGVNRPRQWTRSQSPLRQLLSTGSTSRPGSPPRLRRGEEIGVTKDTSSEHCSEQASNASPMLQTTNTMAPVALHQNHFFGASSTQHEPKQQHKQQQRVSMKNVSHPVSYDECHIPSEDQNDKDNSIARAETIVLLSPDVAAVAGSCGSKSNGPDDAAENEAGSAPAAGAPDVSSGHVHDRNQEHEQSTPC